jgi:hypothetical protein
MTVKEQMTYSYFSQNNIRVYGGFYQWGRKDVGHSLRYGPSDYFTTTPYSKTDTPTKFVTNMLAATLGDWTSDRIDGSNLWGNGGGTSTETDFSASSGTDFNGNSGVANNLKNPCPSGYRVPTIYEWSLIMGGYSFSTTSGGTNTSSSGSTWYVPAGNTNVVWVRVSQGYPVTTFSGIYNKINGFAIYKVADLPTGWDNATTGTFITTADLTADSAPTPLIFLPAAGYRDGNGYNLTTYAQGDYWSSTGTLSYGSFALQFDATTINEVRRTAWVRSIGCSVRCIKNLSGGASDY